MPEKTDIKKTDNLHNVHVYCLYYYVIAIIIIVCVFCFVLFFELKHMKLSIMYVHGLWCICKKNTLNES